MRSFLVVIGLLVLTCSAFAAPVDTVPVNLTVSPYVFAQFADPGPAPAGFAYMYGATEANNKASFNLTVDGNGGTAQDTVNILWACNAPSHIQLDLAPGNLPGTWLMEFDGAGVTPPNQLFITTDTADDFAKLVVPIKLMVSDITVATPKGSYAGTMNITSISNP